MGISCEWRGNVSWLEWYQWVTRHSQIWLGHSHALLDLPVDNLFIICYVSTHISLKKETSLWKCQYFYYDVIFSIFFLFNYPISVFFLEIFYLGTIRSFKTLSENFIGEGLETTFGIEDISIPKSVETKPIFKTKVAL